MKSSCFPRSQPFVSRLVFVAILLFPTLLLAHPGHYHPDETDEFDSFRAFFFHSHGVFDIVLMAVAAVAIFVACFNGKPPVRLGAVIVALGSLVCAQLI